MVEFLSCFYAEPDAVEVRNLTSSGARKINCKLKLVQGARRAKLYSQHYIRGSRALLCTAWPIVVSRRALNRAPNDNVSLGGLRFLSNGFIREDARRAMGTGIPAATNLLIDQGCRQL